MNFHKDDGNDAGSSICKYISGKHQAKDVFEGIVDIYNHNLRTQ